MRCGGAHRSPRMGYFSTHSFQPGPESFGHHYALFQMKLIPIPLSFVLFLAPAITSHAADPAWWATRGVTTTAPQSNLSPATLGQAKHIVAMAMAELQTRLDAPTFQALQADLAPIVNLAIPTTPAEIQQQRAVLVVGQLKAISAPFYRCLHNSYPAWLQTRLTENQNKDSNDSANFYPWSSSTVDDSNRGIATLGQLKSVFALPLEILPPSAIDTDGDGLADAWEIQYFGNLGQIGSGNPDGDSLSTILEFLAGRNPNLADSVADTTARKLDVFNLSPF